MQSGEGKIIGTSRTDVDSAASGTSVGLVQETSQSTSKRKRSRLGNFNLPSVKNIAPNWDDQKIAEWNQRAKDSMRGILDQYSSDRKTQ